VKNTNEFQNVMNFVTNQAVFITNQAVFIKNRAGFISNLADFREITFRGMRSQGQRARCNGMMIVD
jgi:hypothetical protein